jgi:hypothetical protein
LSYHGYALKISSDGLTVSVGDPAVNALTGDATVYARASTALVGDISKQQFEMRVRSVMTGTTGDALGVATALNADGTQFAVAGQHRQNRHTRTEQDTAAAAAGVEHEAVRLPG